MGLRTHPRVPGRDFGAGFPPQTSHPGAHEFGPREPKLTALPEMGLDLRSLPIWPVPSLLWLPDASSENSGQHQPCPVPHGGPQPRVTVESLLCGGFTLRFVVRGNHTLDFKHLAQKKKVNYHLKIIYTDHTLQ